MSKERELLEALRNSIDSGATLPPPPAGGGAAAASSGSSGLTSVLDFMNALFTSMTTDPVFYLKAGAIMILTVVIIVFALQLVADG